MPEDQSPSKSRGFWRVLWPKAPEERGPLGKDVRKYCRALLKHWLWWIGSSAVSIGFAWYQQGGGIVPTWALWAWALSGLAIAGFLAWRDQRGKTKKARKGIAKLKAELEEIGRQKLSGEISRFMFCEGDAGAGICVMLRIISIGPPTTAHSWSLNLRLQGRELSFRAQHLIDDSIQWPIDDESFVKLKAEDMIYEKLVKPIAEGGTEAGFLFFPTGDISLQDFKSENPKLTIRFRDARQTEYEISADGWGQLVPTHEPGIDDPFLAVVLRQMKARQLAAEAPRRQCLDRCIEAYAGAHGPQLTIGALWMAEAYKLETNEDLIWVCEKLKSRGHGDAFGLGEGYGEEGKPVIPQKDWLRFLNDAKLASRSLAGAVEALDAIQEWLTTGKLKPPWVP